MKRDDEPRQKPSSPPKGGTPPTPCPVCGRYRRCGRKWE